MPEDKLSNQHHLVIDTYNDPFADYSMTPRDTILRPYTVAASITITLPKVSDCAGRFFSIVARSITGLFTITIQNQDESEGWEGDIILYSAGQGQTFYSDGLRWLNRTFADIEVEASPRAAYFQARTWDAEAVGVRARAEAAGATASANGVHAQGIAYTGVAQVTVNALYAEAIAKGTSEVTTLRGAMITADSEGTPTSIGTMYGAHIRVKTTVTPSLYRALVIEHEKFGANPGVSLNEYIKIIDSVFINTQTAAAYGLRMLTTGIITTGISLESPMTTGVKVTGAARSFAGTVAAVTSGSYGLSNVATLTSGASEGIAAYFEGHTALAAGNCFAVGAWLNVDSAPASGEMRALDVGIYGVGVDMSSGAATVLNIGFHFDAANPPSAIYPIRFNNTNPGAPATAMFRATQAEAINFQTGADTGATKTGDIPFVLGGVTHYIRTWDGIA